MRVVSLFAVLGFCGAVNLAHAPQLEIKDRSPFATAVLAELNTHLTAGGPADELIKIIGDIRTRINGAGSADDAGWANRNAQCTSTVASLNNQLTGRKGDLAENLGKQATEEGNIKAEKAAVVQYTEVRDQKIADIAALDETIRTLNAKRAYELEVFQNRTKDTEECIAAVKEIIELDGNQLLSDRREDNVATVESQYDYERKDNTINTVAISAQNNLLAVTSKLSAGAKSVMNKAMDGANYNDLASLLGHLASELERYKGELATTETNAISQHATDVADANTERRARVAERREAEKQRGLAFSRQQVAEGKLASLKSEETQIRKHIADLEATINTWDQTCAIQKKEYQSRGADRSAELATLAKIEVLVNDKLGHLLDASDRSNTQQDVHSRVSGVTA